MSAKVVNPECAAVLRDISAYLDGELDAPRCDAIERHSATCSSCAEVVQGFRRTIGLCRGASSEPIPDEVRARARASISALLKADRL
jgi:anti-sigma factor RsiW